MWMPLTNGVFVSWDPVGTERFLAPPSVWMGLTGSLGGGGLTELQRPSTGSKTASWSKVDGRGVQQVTSAAGGGLSVCLHSDTGFIKLAVADRVQVAWCLWS